MNEETLPIHAAEPLNEQRTPRGPLDPKQRYAVYHARNIWAMVDPCRDDWTENRALHYTHVADIEAPIQNVFSLSNHHEGRDWTQNPEVIWYNTSAPVRSTSVGDVILSYQTGQAWLIMASWLQEIRSSPAHTEKPSRLQEQKGNHAEENID